VEKIRPAILRLKHLRRFELRNPWKLSAPLPNLGELGELESLDLARVDGSALEAIDFSSLKKLVELDLWWVDFPSLPASLRDLPRLRTLSIQQTKLTALPKTFATLTALTELKASKTRFTSWPAVLNDLPNLKTIDLNMSKVANLDALRSLPALESLSLEDTPLTHLPARAPHLPSLTTLVLNETQITKLPDWLAELPSLKLLRVGRTELPKSEIAALKRKRASLEVREF
jgi:internalin A